MTDSDLKPNLFIAGFGRSGTTALIEYLKQHPYIFVPWKKEPNALYDNDPKSIWIGGIKVDIMDKESYLKLYINTSKYKYRVDGSTTYSRLPIYARKIKEFNPNAKVIICIREPTSRLISEYLFNYITHKKNFDDWLYECFVPSINIFLTYHKIKEFYWVFGNNLRIIENSMLISKPQKVLDSIFNFLDIPQIKIKNVYSNPSLITPNDNYIYKNILVLTASLAYKLLLISRRLKIEKYFWLLFNTFEYKTAKNFIKRKTHKDYTPLINKIPPDLLKLLMNDYELTTNFINTYNLLAT